MIYVYAGYYELYVSSKHMAEPYMYQGEFETVAEAELFLDRNFDTDNNAVYYERPLIEDSRIYWFYAPLKDDEDKDVIENYTFDLNENGDIADSYDGDICDADDIQTACLAMARWKHEQLKQTLPITEMSENSTNEFKQKFHIVLDDMKGFVTRSVLASCKYKHYDSKTDTMSEENNKALVAITVISARDYQPHAMFSVIVNGKETAFGTDMKKVIEFYNQA